MRVLFLVNVDATTSVPLQLAEGLRDLGVNVETLAFYSEGGPPASGAGVPDLGARHAADARAWQRLFKQLRRDRPDVLHLHHTASAAAGAVTGRLAGIPVVVKTEHYDHRRARTLQAAANGLTLTLAHSIVGNSRATLASFSPWEMALAGRRTLTIHNGVEIERIAEAAERGETVRRRLSIPASAFLVGSVGRLERVKGYSVLLSAAARARREVPSLQVAVVGGGPDGAALRRQVGRLGLGGTIHFLGWLPHEAVYGHLGALDLFVVPSRSEGFCNAVVEAMAAGVPVLCSDLPALREVVGDAGMYAEPGDPGSFAAGIEQIAAWSEEERRARGEAGRVRARKRFSLDRSARRYLAVYGSLLGRENQGPQG